MPSGSPVYATIPEFKNIPVAHMGTYSDSTPSEYTNTVFYDDFQAETDNVPDNWQLFKASSTEKLTL